jgi:hypothetical protein
LLACFSRVILLLCIYLRILDLCDRIFWRIAPSVTKLICYENES